MSKSTKGHLYEIVQMVDNVMSGKESTAACGFTKLLTRDSFNGEQRSICSKCLEASPDEFTVHQRGTWVDLLEQATRARRAASFTTITVSTSTATSANYRFPLAA